MSPLTPAELLIALHGLDLTKVDMKTIIKGRYLDVKTSAELFHWQIIFKCCSSVAKIKCLKPDDVLLLCLLPACSATTTNTRLLQRAHLP